MNCLRLFAAEVEPIPASEAARVVVAEHYLHRRPPISHAFGLFDGSALVGVCTFGVPASRHLQVSVCPRNPDAVIELNRLWVSDDMPRNTESRFIARALAAVPPRLVVSYADTAYGHVGYVYRATNWNYAGLTDADRKTPRYDYIPQSGGHTRDAFRSGVAKRVRRQPKHRYWIATGTRSDKRRLAAKCGWPVLTWKEAA